MIWHKRLRPSGTAVDAVQLSIVEVYLLADLELDERAAGSSGSLTR